MLKMPTYVFNVAIVGVVVGECRSVYRGICRYVGVGCFPPSIFNEWQGFILNCSERFKENFHESDSYEKH